MCNPEPGKILNSCHNFIDDPQDAVVANIYKSNRAEFDRTARKWVEEHAKTSPEEKKISMLMEMGFPKDQCEQALKKYNFDENQALNFLLGA